MGWFGQLIGTDKVLNNVVDKDNGLLAQAGNWIGGFSYTDEEKAEADAETREWGLRQLEALAPFKVMQRIMVTIIMVEWAILFNVLVVAICLDATNVVNNLLLFAQSNFAWIPVAGAVGLYLMGGVIPGRRSRSEK
jgi:hypothetical protein